MQLYYSHTVRPFDYDLTYYLSGPMMGYLEHNFPMFERISSLLRACGIKILSPHEIKHEGENLPWQEYLRGDLIPMLQECRGVIVLPGWPQSKGARMEIDIALKLDWPIYFVEVDLDNELVTLVDMNRQVA